MDMKVISKNMPVEKDMRTALTYFPESPGKLASRTPRKTPKGLAIRTAVIAMAAATRVPRRLLSDDSAVVTAAVLQPNLMTETDTAMVKMEACKAMAMKTVRAALSLS